jgi:hypothetical protein
MPIRYHIAACILELAEHSGYLFGLSYDTQRNGIRETISLDVCHALHPTAASLWT